MHVPIMLKITLKFLYAQLSPHIDPLSGLPHTAPK